MLIKELARASFYIHMNTLKQVYNTHLLQELKQLSELIEKQVI